MIFAESMAWCALSRDQSQLLTRLLRTILIFFASQCRVARVEGRRSQWQLEPSSCVINDVSGPLGVASVAVEPAIVATCCYG